MMTRFLLMFAGALTLMLCVPASQADTESITVTFAGTGYDTTVDNFDDGLPLGLVSAHAKGSFGAKQVDISSEFLEADVDCQAGYLIELGLVYSAWVITYADNSQTFGYCPSGWACVNPTTGHYYGEVEGVFLGGTGRFEGVSGELISRYDGYNLEPPGLEPVGFRTMTGKTTGTIELP